MAVDGKEITDYGKRGELLIQGPSVMLGYLNNDKANADSFVWDKNGRWLKTGDEVMMKQAASGNDHLVIVDRIKELIKVKVWMSPSPQPPSLEMLLVQAAFLMR